MTDWVSSTTYTIRSGSVSLALESNPSSNVPGGDTPSEVSSANGKDSPFFLPKNACFHGENMGEQCYYWPLVLT